MRKSKHGLRELTARGREHVWGNEMDDKKAAISIADMARMVGLSRARFYQLMGTTFPWPVYPLSNRRPFYDEKLRDLCLEVRRRNCGIDGKPVMFYARRVNPIISARKPRKVTPAPKTAAGHDDILDGLKSLGLLTARRTRPRYRSAEPLGPLPQPSGSDDESVGPGLVEVGLTPGAKLMATLT